MFCGFCGQTLIGNERFCTSCGKPVSESFKNYDPFSNGIIVPDAIIPETDDYMSNAAQVTAYENDDMLFVQYGEYDSQPPEKPIKPRRSFFRALKRAAARLERPAYKLFKKFPGGSRGVLVAWLLVVAIIVTGSGFSKHLRIKKELADIEPLFTGEYKSGESFDSGFMINGDTIIYQKYMDGYGVFSSDINGDNEKKLFSEWGSVVQILDDKLYFFEYGMLTASRYICSANLDGTGKKRLIKLSAESSIIGMVVDRNYIYYSLIMFDSEDYEKRSFVTYRMRLSGKEHTKLNILDGYAILHMDKENIYCSKSDNRNSGEFAITFLCKYRKSDGKIEKVTSLGYYSRCVFDGNFAYYLENDDLVRVALNTGKSEKVRTTDDYDFASDILSFTVKDGVIYTLSSLGNVEKIVDGNITRLLTVEPNQSQYINNICAGDKYLFIISNCITRVELDGSNPTQIKQIMPEYEEYPEDESSSSLRAVMPDFKGLTQDEALSECRNISEELYENIRVELVPSVEEPGTVVGQFPSEGGLVTSDGYAVIRIAKDMSWDFDGEFIMPYLLGYTQEEADIIIRDLVAENNVNNISCSYNYVTSSGVPGEVVWQEPVYGSLINSYTREIIIDIVDENSGPQYHNDTY